MKGSRPSLTKLKELLSTRWFNGGKGVLVQGDHFHSRREALQACHEILKTHSSVMVEEKLEGEEFSLQCLCDGKTVVATTSGPGS